MDYAHCNPAAQGVEFVPKYYVMDDDQSSSMELSEPSAVHQSDTPSVSYFPLSSREIRLVSISPGSSDEPIECKLTHAPLANKPEYKALSYVWGSSRRQRRITVDGQDHYITVNLLLALQRIRQSDKTVVLWVDALSINQQDVSERSAQVSFMRDIFEGAVEVVVYLGQISTLSSIHTFEKNKTEIATFSTPSHQAQSRSADVESLLARYFPWADSKQPREYPHPPVSEEEVFALIEVFHGPASECLDTVSIYDEKRRTYVDSRFELELFEALRLFMRSAWWKRIWVVQEVVVAKAVTVLYGSATIAWDDVVKAAVRYDRHQTTCCRALVGRIPRESSAVLSYFSQGVKNIADLREAWQNDQRHTLISLLRKFRGRQASDDRDKVYALLGLAVQNGLEGFTPSYTVDVADVFVRATYAAIRHDRTLSSLTCDYGRKYRTGLPSWTPDWGAAEDFSNQQWSDRTNLYNAGGDCVSHPQPGNGFFAAEPAADDVPSAAQQGMKKVSPLCPEGIALHGKSVDKVTRVGAPMLSGLSDMVEVVEQWADMIVSSWDSMGQPLFVVHFEGELYPPFRQDQFEFLRIISADTTQLDSKAVRGACYFQRIDAYAFETEMRHGTILRRPLAMQVPDILHYLLGGPDGILGDFATQLCGSIRTASFRRRLFVTNKGLMGLGPMNTAIGDEVCILEGSRTPLMLRRSGGVCLTGDIAGLSTPHPWYDAAKLFYGYRTSDSGQRRILHNIPEKSGAWDSWPNCYELIGDCYAQGMMDGKLMKLPDPPTRLLFLV